jgi:transcriptional antiterminator RfaH
LSGIKTKQQTGDAMTHHHCKSWFLAQLKPNCAHIADRNLKQQGFRTFLPMEEGTQNRKGRFIPTLRPMFPGYVFVFFDIAGGLWRKIYSTLDIVSQLMLRCDSAGKLLPPKLLKPGDQVRLASGPFANFVARIDDIAPDQRVWVLIDIMGRQTRMAVGADQLRAV